MPLFATFMRRSTDCLRRLGAKHLIEDLFQQWPQATAGIVPAEQGRKQITVYGNLVLRHSLFQEIRGKILTF